MDGRTLASHALLFEDEGSRDYTVRVGLLPATSTQARVRVGGCSLGAAEIADHGLSLVRCLEGVSFFEQLCRRCPRRRSIHGMLPARHPGGQVEIPRRDFEFGTVRR